MAMDPAVPIKEYSATIFFVCLNTEARWMQKRIFDTNDSITTVSLKYKAKYFKTQTLNGDPVNTCIWIFSLQKRREKKLDYNSAE